MRSSAVTAGIVLSRGADLDVFDLLLLAGVLAAGVLGWYLE